jgi:two-component system phosphate regulon sensor histidine kinase PhoR
LARLETDRDRPARDPVSVPALLATIREDATQLSGDKRHVITLDADPATGLFGSVKELHSAFGNLVINAVRYTPAGGRIEIRWWADTQGAHFSVRDSGIGIEARHIPRLTERFYRIDVGRSRDSGGTGLGLAIVKHVLNRHDGRLRVESTPGKGSTFTCDFPSQRVLRNGFATTKYDA